MIRLMKAGMIAALALSPSLLAAQDPQIPIGYWSLANGTGGQGAASAAEFTLTGTAVSPVVYIELRDELSSVRLVYSGGSLKPGTYPVMGVRLPNSFTVAYSRDGNFFGVGTVTVDSVSPTRIVGHFELSAREIFAEGREFPLVGQFAALERDFGRAEQARAAAELRQLLASADSSRWIRAGFPLELILSVRAGRLSAGMNPEMVRAVWGEPLNIQRTTPTGRIREVWVYNSRRQVTFEDQRVVEFRD